MILVKTRNMPDLNFKHKAAQAQYLTQWNFHLFLWLGGSVSCSFDVNVLLRADYSATSFMPPVWPANSGA